MPRKTLTGRQRGKKEKSERQTLAKKKKKRAVTATVGATAGKKADNPIICRLNPERRASSAKKKQKPAAEVDESGRLFQVWSRGEEKEKFVSRFASLVGTKNVKKKEEKETASSGEEGRKQQDPQKEQLDDLICRLSANAEALAAARR